MPVVAQRLLRAVARQRFELPGGGELRVTTSIGWSFYPMFGGTRLDQNWEDVLEIADRALYLAKRNGRNMAVGLVGAEDPALSADVGEVRSDIRRAVESGHLGLVSTREVSDLG
jgi:predicted signal transduction protein with EAL and GGDEF domain